MWATPISPEPAVTPASTLTGHSGKKILGVDSSYKEAGNINISSTHYPILGPKEVQYWNIPDKYGDSFSTSLYTTWVLHFIQLNCFSFCFLYTLPLFSP